MIIANLKKSILIWLIILYIGIYYNMYLLCYVSIDLRIYYADLSFYIYVVLCIYRYMYLILYVSIYRCPLLANRRHKQTGIYLTIYLSMNLSIYIYISFYVSNSLCICVSIGKMLIHHVCYKATKSRYASICLCIYLSIYLLTYPSIPLSIYVSID
jgi:hypothetical protein